ncbi:helix-turn-helix domain-containing protein [Amycolatopsis magusensis]|uniref:helix-turn-helix domain-containing protein n=1 Tax=Amycolatopsis magusensis TaxID=882444 RepID=UPI0037953C2F
MTDPRLQLVLPEEHVPDDERMHSVELQCVREYLGLTLQALADYLGVTARTVRHWESGTYLIPDTVRVAIESLEVETGEYVGMLVEHLKTTPDPAVVVCRSDEQYQAAGNGTAPYTARWHRQVVMRAVIEVPGVRIIEHQEQT